MPVLQIRVRREDVAFCVNVLVDNCATLSTVSDELVRKLGAVRYSCPSKLIETLGGNPSFTLKERVVIRVEHVSGQFHSVCPFYIIPKAVLPRVRVPSSHYHQLAKERGLQIATPTSPDGAVRVDMLLGNDYFVELFMTMPPEAHLLSNTVAAISTKLGWMLSGRQAEGELASRAIICASQSVEHRCEACRDTRALYSDPISDGGDEGDAIGEEWAARYEASIQYDEGSLRYIARLPWLGKERPLCNYHSAMVQCKAMTRGLESDGSFEAYDEVMRTLISEGSAEEVVDLDTRDGYYVPHRPVYKAGSTTKIRPVFNASSRPRKNEASLNDCIFVGSWSQTKLLDILVRWRLHRYTILSDLKKAFLQIRVHPEDRKYLRFLWYKNGRLRTYQMTSVLFGATSSPYMLHAAVNRVAADHAAPAARDLANILYMDDAAFCASSIQELVEKVVAAQDALRKGSFDLHKWAAPKWIRDTWPKELALEFVETEVHKVLGVPWDLETDTVPIELPDLRIDQTTRRTLASVFARAFDPMGLLGPVLARIRIFMRRICEYSIEWDKPLSEDLVAEAQLLINDLQHIVHVRVPRVCVHCKYEVWVFADASGLAYGMCLYIYNQDQSHGILLLSRGRLCNPLRTIPQLELCAAVLAAETYVAMRSEFAPDAPVRMFSDSTITLSRIAGGTNQHEPFVRNRLNRIKELDEEGTLNWFHVPTKLNPADLVSRGVAAKNLHQNELWFRGPRREDLDLDRARATVLLIHLTGARAKELYRQSANTPFKHLQTIFTTFLDFVERRYGLVSRLNEGKKRPVTPGQLATIRIWQLVQSATLSAEIEAVRAGRALPSKSPLVSREFTRCFIDEWGLLRVDRRLSESELTFAITAPIIVRDHQLVRSFVEIIHSQRLLHAGEPGTAAYLSRTILIIGGSTIIRAVLKKCARCLRRDGAAYNPIMAPLPEGRVTGGRAFRTCGIDIFGPIYDRPLPIGRLQRKRSKGQRQKYYGLLFVCAASRAVHLELLSSRHATSVNNALIRFFKRRGMPHRIYSDNELAFKKNGELLNLHQTIRAASKRRGEYEGIRWTFNPPGVPWWGGFYERLVGTVKRALFGFKPQRIYSYDELHTMLTVAEALVNTRPLVKRSAREPSITPAHLVLGHAHLLAPAFELERDGGPEDALLSFAGLSRKLNVFWRNWSISYLLSLRRHHQGRLREPKSGELVIVQQTGIPRGDWPIGVIKSVDEGRDGVGRMATVTLLDGQSEVRRVAQHLVPLEAQADWEPPRESSN